MNKKIVAIGGGENGRLRANGEYALYETEPMDKEIVRLTSKDKPNFLFICHAQSESYDVQESYFQTMKKIFGEKLGCECRDLKSDELNDKNVVNEKVNWADIIYEGGGNTLEMVHLWETTGFDKVLYNAWNSGKVICGVSAGACCWFKSCNSDSGDNESGYSSVRCLNWFNAHFTPHCDEGDRYKTTKEQLKENGLVGLMFSNCTAIEIIDDNYRFIFSDSKRLTPYVLKAYWKDDEYVEENMYDSEEYRSINELLEKK